jgi:hypothetical protein
MPEPYSRRSTRLLGPRRRGLVRRIRVGTRMSVISFGVAVLLGRMLLFLAIAFGASALFN